VLSEVVDKLVAMDLDLWLAYKGLNFYHDHQHLHLALERLNLAFDHKELEGMPSKVVGELSQLLRRRYLYLPLLFLRLQQDLGLLAGIDADGQGAPVEAARARMAS